MSESLKDKTAKGFLWGFLNNSTMQILNAVFGIVLSRILDKADYGIIGMMVIFTSIASSLQDSGFVTALTNKKDASHTDYNSVFWFNICASLCLYVLFFICSPLLAAFYEEPILTSLFRFYSLGFFFASFSIVPRAILFKQLRQKDLTVVTVVALFVSGITGIAMALNGMAYWGMAAQGVVYTSVVSLVSWWISGWRPSLNITMKPVREMFGFSSKMLLTNIFQQVNNNIFSVVLGKIYTKSEVGLYNQANKWNLMGASTITGMVQGVAQPTFVQVGDDRERLCRAFSKMLRFTCFVAFPAMFGMSLIAPEFIVILITEKWLDSAYLMRILCIGGAFLPISTLYFNLIISRGKSSVYMWNIIIQGITILAAILLIHVLGGTLQMMVWAYVAIVILWVGIWNYFVRKEIGFSFLQTLRDIAPFFFIASVSMLATYYLTTSIANIYVLLAVRIALAATLYIACMWLLGAKILKECVSYLRKKAP